LNAFYEENDLSNVIPDNRFLHELIKIGVIINNSQLPDIYTKLQIPIDKRKAFFICEFKINNDEKKVITNQQDFSFSQSKFTLDSHIIQNQKNKFFKNFKNNFSLNNDYFCDKILYPLIPFSININRFSSNDGIPNNDI